MAKPYGIVAGNPDRPETIMRGNLEKGMGQIQIAGTPIEVLNARGVVGVPNYTEAWAVRLDRKGEIPAEPINVRDAGYSGQIKELEWNDPKGCLVVCRYLKGYNSIDQQYQNLVLNAEAKFKDNPEAEAEVTYLTFQNGDNWNDPETDKYLCQMIRVHYLNESSKSRNPEGANFKLRDIDEIAEAAKSEGAISDKFEALKVVNQAAEDNTFIQLDNLLTVISKISEETPKKANLYRYLQTLADKKPTEFLGQIQEHKKSISQIFEKLKSYKAVDFSKKGTIAAGENKKEIIGEGIPGKDEAMVLWVIDNFLTEKAWSIFVQAKQISENLK